MDSLYEWGEVDLRDIPWVDKKCIQERKRFTGDDFKAWVLRAKSKKVIGGPDAPKEIIASKDSTAAFRQSLLQSL